MGVVGEDGVVGLEGIPGEVGGALVGADGDVELGVSGCGAGGGRTRGLPMQTMRGDWDMVRGEEQRYFVAALYSRPAVT